MNKKVKATVATVGALMMAFTGVACGGGGKPETGVGTLDIYIHKAGYGNQWMYDIKDAFMNEQWVKDKYENLNVIITSLDQESYVKTKLETPNNNHFDLLLGFDSDYPKQGEDILEDLYTDVYNQDVPGESIKYIDKYFDSYAEMSKYVSNEAGAAPKYYVTAWASGMNGIFYNVEKLNALGVSVPRTTGELLAICNTVYANRTDGVAGDDAYEGYSFVQAQGLAYCSYLFPIWWAQYEGVKGYNNYYNGISGDSPSKEIFDQEGRLYSLQMLEKILENDKHLDPSSLLPEYNAKTAQSAFLRGNALFHVNGDWFENEMAERKAGIKQEEGIEYTFKMMRTPIISELGVKLGITDSELASIVDYVDGVVATAPTFTSTKNYPTTLVLNAVKEARGVVHSIGAQHYAYVPNYAREKDIAKDFLRYMATDKAQALYMQATGGCSLPFDYEVQTVNPTLYNQLTPMQKDRWDFINSNLLTVQTLRAPESFPLVKHGGLRAFTVTDEAWLGYLSIATKTKTAKDIYDETKKYWVTDDSGNQKWDTAFSKAGLSLN